MKALGQEGLDAEGLARLARRAAEADDALARMTDELAARLGRPDRSTPAPCSTRRSQSSSAFSAARIAAAGGRDPTRIGLEKIEALALRLRDACAEGRPLVANVGGAAARLTAAGRLSFEPEPARRGRGL